MTLQAVALSGGKDSTAMALRLAEIEPDTERVYFCTPTGDELPEMVAHWEMLERLLGQPLLRLQARWTLDTLIEFYGSLPNWRQRWCTRQLKIEPCLAWLAAQPARPILCVGLRADEEERKGIFSEKVVTRFPLREWGWGLAEVKSYLTARGVTIPKRTDCARCYGQRLGEWFDLWREYPAHFAAAEQQEAITGHTFRSPGRDTWPAALKDLRARFERGDLPRGRRLPIAEEPCRVCRL